MVKFKVASVFSDCMVLQRNKKICIFGEGENGKEVSAQITFTEDGAEKTNSASSVCKDGRWEVFLPEMKENSDCTLLVSCGDEKKEFSDIAIGEVWLCGGQSNMEFELQHMTGGKEHLENDNPNVRFYYTQKKGFIDEEFLRSESMMVWKKFDPESAKCWSAVGYLFGKKLSEALGVTVGLIGCNWGGTSASAWMSREAILAGDGTSSYFDDFAKSIEGKSEEQQIREYEEYLAYAADWEKKYGELWQKKPGIGWDEAQKIIGPNLWPGPMGIRNPFRPTGLYDCMLKRVAPYTLAGWLFYQGESDDHKPNLYYSLFSEMIADWRRLWNEKLPMLFVQLPGNRYETDPDYKHWCIIREAQQKVSETVENTAMACIIDAGEFNDIHPKDKEPVGDRLYRIAMEKIYGGMDAEEAESPEPISISFENGSAVISYRYTGGELTLKKEEDDNEGIFGFELCGADGEYVPAKAVLGEDKKSVIVTAAGLEEPKNVRYLWTNYPEKVELYSAAGIPARPFRTDKGDNREAAHETKIQQIMEL